MKQHNFYSFITSLRFKFILLGLIFVLAVFNIGAKIYISGTENTVRDNLSVIATDLKQRNIASFDYGSVIFKPASNKILIKDIQISDIQHNNPYISNQLSIAELSITSLTGSITENLKTPNSITEQVIILKGVSLTINDKHIPQELVDTVSRVFPDKEITGDLIYAPYYMDENASRIKSVSINLYNLGKTILAFESSSNDLEIISGFLIYEDKGMISSLLSGAYYYRTKDESANFTQAKQQETDHLIQKYKIDAKHANYLSNPTGKKHYTIFTPNEAVPVKSLFNAFLEGSMNKDDFSYEIID